MREAILTDQSGKTLFANPSEFLSAPNGRERLRLCISHIAQNVARLLSGHAKRRYAASGADHKKDLKNKEHVSNVRAEIIPQYQIICDNGYTETFEKKWKATEKGNGASLCWLHEVTIPRFSLVKP